MMAAGIANAQPPAPLDLQVLETGTTVDGLNGGAANGEFDGVATKPDGTVHYFVDSISTFDGIFTSAGPAVFASESQLSTNTNFSAGDMDADANNLYVSMFDSTAAKQSIWRIPHTGFGTAAKMVDETGSTSVNLDEVSVDSKNSRLIINYNDSFAPATVENIVYVPLTATLATPTLLVTEAALEAALATITGYADDTLDDINVYDMAVQSDGDIIASQGFSANRQVNGSLLRITDTGTVSVFRTGDQIITAAGGNPALVDIGSVNVYRLQDDRILIHVNAVSGIDEFIAVVSADGTSQIQLVTDAQLTADSSVTVSLVPAGQSICHNGARSAMDGKSGDVAANDDYYFYR